MRQLLSDYNLIIPPMLFKIFTVVTFGLVTGEGVKASFSEELGQFIGCSPLGITFRLVLFIY